MSVTYPTSSIPQQCPLVDINGQPVTSPPSGNPFLVRDLEWDAETGFYCASRSKGGGYGFGPPHGGDLSVVGGENPLFQGAPSSINPLFDPLGFSSPGGSGGYFDPKTASAIGAKVKIISGAKCFGAYQPKLQSCDAQYNPKEVGLDKSVPWNK
jgi:hypothetical protein